MSFMKKIMTLKYDETDYAWEIWEGGEVLAFGCETRQEAIDLSTRFEHLGYQLAQGEEEV